jgi:hypothetical protein
MNLLIGVGALQTLLSTLLGRAGEWTDVTVSIAKVVCVLVTYEEDWALLQRSAMGILTALHALLAHSHRGSAEAAVGSLGSRIHQQQLLQPLGRSGSNISNGSASGVDDGLQQNSGSGLLLGSALEHDSLASNLPDNGRPQPPLGGHAARRKDIVPPLDLRQPQQNLTGNRGESDCGNLELGDNSTTTAGVAAAAAKLSLVLCSEWGGGGMLGSVGSANGGSSLAAASALPPSFVAPAGSGAATGQLLQSTGLDGYMSMGGGGGVGGAGANSGGAATTGRQRSHSNTGPPMQLTDLHKVLSMLMNLIRLLAEPSESSLRLRPPSFSSLSFLHASSLSDATHPLSRTPSAAIVAAGAVRAAAVSASGSMAVPLLQQMHPHLSATAVPVSSSLFPAASLGSGGNNVQMGLSGAGSGRSQLGVAATTEDYMLSAANGPGPTVRVDAGASIVIGSQGSVHASESGGSLLSLSLPLPSYQEAAAVDMLASSPSILSIISGPLCPSLDLADSTAVLCSAALSNLAEV